MKKINFYVLEIASLCFLAGCSSASPNAEKKNTVNYLNSIRTQAVKAESGSLTINTEWNIGGEIERIETAEQGDITSYTIVYSSDYCSSKGNDTEIGSSVLQSKILELELMADETVKAVKLNTAGYVSGLNASETPVSQKTELYLN